MWIKCVDHKTPKSISIDLICSRIYTLTEQGLFSVWDLRTFDVIKSEDFKKPRSRSVIAFKVQNKVMIVFFSEIVVLDADEQKNTYLRLDEYSLSLKEISDAKISNDDTILAVATTSATAPVITIYATDGGFKEKM